MPVCDFKLMKKYISEVKVFYNQHQHVEMYIVYLTAEKKLWVWWGKKWYINDHAVFVGDD